MRHISAAVDVMIDFVRLAIKGFIGTPSLLALCNRHHSLCTHAPKNSARAKPIGHPVSTEFRRDLNGGASLSPSPPTERDQIPNPPAVHRLEDDFFPCNQFQLIEVPCNGTSGHPT